MKKILLLSVLFSSFAAADDHFYGGAGLLVGHQTELEANGASIDESNDLGLHAFGGYNFDLSPNFDLGLEAEFQYFGKAEFVEGVSVDGQAFYINARPKFTESTSNIYSALILGIGTLKGEANVLGSSGSDNEISYQAGVEVGYMFEDVDVGIGYRYRTADFDGLDVNIHGVTLGLTYNF